MPRFNVVVSSRFLQRLHEIGPAGYDWADMMAGVKFYLSHAPLEVGYATQDSQVRIILQVRPLGFSGVKVFYVVDGGTVTLLTALPYEPGAND